MSFGEVENKAYDHMNAKKLAEGRHGTQPGDPVKGARAMYELATMQDPPLRAVIGSDAYKLMQAKVENDGKLVKKFEKLSLSTDVDE